MANPTPKLTRRSFLSNSAAVAAGVVVTSRLSPLLHAATAPGPAEFVSNWKSCPDRVWLGPEFWSNPLQDWRVADGRIECTNAAPDRNVHVLVRALGEKSESFTTAVRVGRADGALLSAGKGSVGFRIGVRGPLPDFRNALVFGRGLDAGLTADGALFIGALGTARPAAGRLEVAEAELRLSGVPTGSAYRLTLTLLDGRGAELAAVSKDVPRDQCVGGLVLVNNFPSVSGPVAGKAAAKKAAKATGTAASGAGAVNAGVGRFWFADWRVSGSKVEAHPDRTFGPLLFSQYTLSAGIMKMTAQLPPIGSKDAQTVSLQLQTGGTWKTVGEERIHPEARTATFRIPNWEVRRDTPYRLAYNLTSTDGRQEEHFWTGTVRRDPVDVPSFSVADISCNIHEAFPNAPYVENVGKVNPDLLAFTGDQFYESSGGFGVIRTPVDGAMIDYLRKWYLHGWTWRELMRDRPSISLPDDHDVYQGNIWGEGGAARTTTQEAGGYDMPADWVNVVYRTQTAHHPDPYDPTPAKRGTLQYYGPLTYGRISFAVLADRQYKSAPEGNVPPTGGRGDHETNPNFDPKTADIPGLNLLGAKQEEFLEKWVEDWRGADMKAVISQTIFSAFPTTHGRGTPMILRADYDTNGWPQTARNRAVRTIRKAFAFHIAGDQHIPGVVQYGVDEHRDASVAFAGPAVNVGYPRWFEPSLAPWTKPKGASLTGDFTESFGHPFTVHAVMNAAKEPRAGDVRQFLDDKASGFGLVRFDKQRQTIRVECWPFLADFTKTDTQMPGWPIEIKMLENYGRKIAGHLPSLTIRGAAKPVIHVYDEASGELVYALRATGPSFRPHVFAPGKYRVRVSDPDRGNASEVRGLQPSAEAQKPVTVSI